MMWPFKKKEAKEPKIHEFSELPELPELPPFPEFKAESLKRERIKDELPPLPSFPNSPTGEKISNEAVKQAINHFKGIPENMQKFPKRTREGITPMQKPVVREMSPEIRTEPIFVRIDRYQQSMMEFQEIKRNLLEIENILKNIKDVREREEAELNEWEEEARTAKEKLDSIDRSIFKKLED